MLKVVAVLCAGLLCAPVSAIEPTFAHNEAAIVKVKCAGNGVVVRGSAFKVGDNTYITAAHVVDMGSCLINGVFAAITSIDQARDYATLIGPSSPDTLKVNCDGFLFGKPYLARGFPFGGDYKIAAPWLAIGPSLDGYRAFIGEAIPGMSGGPVLNENGEVVGLINMKLPARSMPLKLTGYCGAGGWPGDHPR